MKKLMIDPACFKSAVEHQLELPKHDPEFTSFSNDGSEWIFRTDYGHVRLTVPEGQCEYWSDDLCENAILIKLIWISPKERNKGRARRLLRKVVEIYQETEVVLILYAYPVEMSGSTIDTVVVDSLEIQKRLVNWYFKEGFEVADYEKVYVPWYLIKMFERHIFHRVKPILMTKAMNHASDNVLKELGRIKLEKENWKDQIMKEDAQKEQFCPWRYMSGDYLM